MSPATEALIADAQARLDADLARLTPWGVVGDFLVECWEALLQDVEDDRARLWRLENQRRNAAYERRRDAHRQAFARMMAESGYATVDGKGFGLVEPKGQLEVAELPE